MGKRNKGKKRTAEQSKGGSMMGLRSGFQSAVGQKKKKKKRAKSSPGFVSALLRRFFG